jgi:hypothetical protein
MRAIHRLRLILRDAHDLSLDGRATNKRVQRAVSLASPDPEHDEASDHEEQR